MVNQGQRMVAALYAHYPPVEYALVECIAPDCDTSARQEGSARMTDAQLVDYFTSEGWSILPTLCPKHKENPGGA